MKLWVHDASCRNLYTTRFTCWMSCVDAWLFAHVCYVTWAALLDHLCGCYKELNLCNIMKTRWICMLARGPCVEVLLLNITTNSGVSENCWTANWSTKKHRVVTMHTHHIEWIILRVAFLEDSVSLDVHRMFTFQNCLVTTAKVEVGDHLLL
jgi:hypothetical protein